MSAPVDALLRDPSASTGFHRRADRPHSSSSVVHSYPQVLHTCGKRRNPFDASNAEGGDGVSESFGAGLETPPCGYSTSREGSVARSLDQRRRHLSHCLLIE